MNWCMVRISIDGEDDHLLSCDYLWYDMLKNMSLTDQIYWHLSAKQGRLKKAMEAS